MLEDRPVTWARDRLHVTTDRRLIPLADVLSLLHETYWAKTLTADALERATRNSICFAVLDGTTLVGFARAITDLTTYAYLSDVVIAESHRGQQLGQWLVRCILEHPDLSGLRRFALLTRDAADFYVRLGFKHGAGERNYLELLPGRAPPPVGAQGV